MFRKKKKTVRTFDSETLEPAIRTSICTGEQVAGFRNRKTGRFSEDRLIRCPQDLEDFMEEYGLSESPREFY